MKLSVGLVLRMRRVIRAIDPTNPILDELAQILQTGPSCQARILAMLEAPMTTTEIRKKLRISQSHTWNELRTLQAEQLVELLGTRASGKGGPPVQVWARKSEGR